MFQLGTSSPGVYSSMEEVCSLPIHNFNRKNICSSNKNVKDPATASSQRSEGFTEFSVKAYICVY